MYILDLVREKSQGFILSYEDIQFSENELNNLKIISYNKKNLETNLNIAFKELNNLLLHTPNYDTYVIHLIRLAEELETSFNLNQIKKFVLITTPLERFGSCSYSYIWAIRYLIFNKFYESNFWEQIYLTTNERCKYLAKLAIASQKDKTLNELFLRELVADHDSKKILIDIKALNLADDNFVLAFLDNIKKDNLDLYQKIMRDFAND